jgi:hypothetical protein
MECNSEVSSNANGKWTGQYLEASAAAADDDDGHL